MTTALVILSLVNSCYGIPARMASFSVSAYNDTGIMASGEHTRDGVCACGPGYDFGTVFIVGGRVVVCRDRGGKVTDGHVDMWMKSERDAVEWGRKQLATVVVGR